MKNANETYNGWTNWETWKVHLEVFDGCSTTLTAEECADIANDYYTHEGNENAYGFVMDALERVNWDEIAEATIQD